MASEKKKHELTEDELKFAADAGLQGQGHVVEAMFRLKRSIDAFSKSTDFYSKVMLFLTVVLTVLTALLVYKEFRP